MALVTLAGKTVRAKGVYRGQLMWLEFPKPPRSLAVSVRLFAAGLEDMQSAINRMVEKVQHTAGDLARVTATPISDEHLAYAAFVRDGGDPASIRRIERAFNVRA